MPSTHAANALRAVSVAYAGIGLVWATIAFAPIDAPGRLFTDLLDWPLDDVPTTLDPLERWTHAVGAGLLVALAVAFALVVAPAVERGDRQAVRGAALALGAWYVIDTAGAVANGMGSVGWNTLFLLGWAVPLLLARGGLGDPGARGSSSGNAPPRARSGGA